jgi:hypothetical protein
MTDRRSLAILIAGAGLAASVAVGAGADPVRGVGPLPVPIPPTPIPSLPLPSLPLPGPSLPLPSPSLPAPIPSLPLPSLPLPVPSPSLPLPSVGTGLPTSPVGTPSPIPGRATPSAAPSPAGRSAAGTSDRDDTGTPAAPSDDVTGGVSGGTRTAPFTRPTVPAGPPIPPSLPGVGSWLIPALGIAVPVLFLAALMAVQVLSGVVGLQVARGGLRRIGAMVPPWLGQGPVNPRGGARGAS